MPPSHKTIKRAVRAVDAAAADEQLCAWLRAEAAAGRLNWRHIAIDGKTVRGAVRPDGTQPHLLAAYDVTAGTVLGQASVGAKTNEITCFVPLLHAILDSPRASSPGHDGDGDGDGDDAGAGAGAGAELVIVTADALHTQAGHVEAMNKLRIGWILDLKDNQPGLYALADAHPWHEEPVLHATAETGHGRDEIRTIRVTSQVPDGITRRFPGTSQMMLIERYRHDVRGSAATAACRAVGDDPHMTCAAGAKISCETVLALTALTPAQAGPEFLLARNRGHWGIENGLHLRRDTTYAEDASRLRAGDAPRLFASIASTVVSVLNHADLTNHAAARRDLAWDRTGLRALGLLLGPEGLAEGRTHVAEEDGSLVGFATWTETAGTIELEDLFVDPGYMRRGIAAALVNRIVDVLRARGVERLEVTANPHALGFYRAVGFIDCGVAETDFGAAPRMELVIS